MALRSYRAHDDRPNRRSAPQTSSQPSWLVAARREVATWLIVIASLTLVGALIAVCLVEIKGKQYRATINVRSATADATCGVYFTCLEPSSTIQGNPYVLDQVNAILSPVVASEVAKQFPRLTVATLLSHVCAQEIGRSATIAVCYRAGSSHEAGTIALAYANAYVDWSNAQAVAALAALDKSLSTPRNGLTLTQILSRQNQSVIASVELARQSYQAHTGPNGAKMFGSRTAHVVTVTQATGPAETVALGAASGFVLAIGLLLAVPPLLQGQNPSHRSDEERPESRITGESPGPFTAPATNVVTKPEPQGSPPR